MGQDFRMSNDTNRTFGEVLETFHDPRQEIATAVLAAMLTGLASIRASLDEHKEMLAGVLELPGVAVRLTDDLLRILSETETPE